MSMLGERRHANRHTLRHSLADAQQGLPQRSGSGIRDLCQQIVPALDQRLQGGGRSGEELVDEDGLIVAGDEHEAGPRVVRRGHVGEAHPSTVYAMGRAPRGAARARIGCSP